jgi:hypothetical protein
MNVEGLSGLVNRVIAWADGMQRGHGVLRFPYAVVKKYGDDEGAGSCKHSPGPARLKKDIEYQARGRHGPGAVRPRNLPRGLRRPGAKWRWPAISPLGWKGGYGH